MTGIAPGRSHAGYGFAGGLLMMAGLGLSLVRSTIVATRGLPPEMSGLGSALTNTSRLLGGALGLAILVTVAAAHTHADIGRSAGQALTDGFSRSLAISTAVCAAGATLAIVLLGTGAEPGRARARVAGNALPAHDDARPPPPDLSSYRSPAS